MIGIKLKLVNNKLQNLKFFNNSNPLIKLNHNKFNIIIIGQVFEKKNIIKETIKNALDKKNYKSLLKLNGEYAIVIINKTDKLFIIGNSQNSYLPIFYSNLKNELVIDFNILNFHKKYFSKINFKKIYEWLTFNGRSFNDETFIRGINVLESGSLIIKKKEKFKKVYLPPFYYQPKIISLNEATKKVSNTLKNAINQRLSETKNTTQFGLSGGLDSRILVSLINKENLKKIKSYTISTKFSFEKKISKTVAKYLKLQHKEINVPIKEYYMSAFESVKHGGFNNIFKSGVYRKFLKAEFETNKNKNIMIGNALDVLIASSFSSKDLIKIKNRKQYIDWYVNKYQLFSVKELTQLFKNKKFSKVSLNKNLEKFLNKYNFSKNNSIDINDAFTFETRIKRWHNYTLSAISNFTNFLIPTYDNNFLKICSSIPYKFRLNDLLRKNILKSVDSNLYNLKTSNSLEIINIKKKKNFKSFFDVNLGFDIKKNDNIYLLLDKIKKELTHLKKEKFLDIPFIEAVIDEHKNSNKENTRKIFLLISLLISMIFIFRKQNNNYEKN